MSEITEIKEGEILLLYTTRSLLHRAAESLGLGAVWTAAYPYSDRYASMKRELGMPDTVLPYCAVAVGYPANEEQPKDKWRPERIHYGQW